MTQVQTPSTKARRSALPAATQEGEDGAPDIQKRGLATKWWPLLIVVVPATAFLLLYVQRTYVDVVVLDGFVHVPYIGAALAKGGSLGDLVQAPFSGEHLLLAYRLLLFANAKLLALDMRLDPVMFVVASAATAWILFAECARIFRSLRPSLLLLAFLPLGFLSFSLVAPPLFLMTTQFVWGTVVALLIAFLVQRDFDPEQQERPFLRRPLARALILIPVYFVVSGAYFPGLVLGLAGVFVFRRLLERSRWLEHRVVLMAAVILPCAAAYTYFMSGATRPSSTSGGIMTFFTDPLGSLLSYLAAIGASLLDSHTVAKTSSPVLGAVGLAGAFMIVVSLWIFVKTKMYLKTYLPVYCIFYSLGIVTAVRTGRTSGWRWIGNEWYAFHLRFFLIGVAWILVHTTIELLHERRATTVPPARRGSWLLAFTILAAVFISGCQLQSNVAQWNRSRYVKEYYDQKRLALLYPQLFDDPAEILLWPANQVARARVVLEKYSLSSFSARSRDEIDRRLKRQTLRGSDWYGDDWIGRDGRALLVAARPSPINFWAQVPGFLPRNHCEFRLNDAVIFAGELTQGKTKSLSGRLQSGVNTVTVACTDSVSAASKGQGADGRPLAVHVKIKRG